jgi:hypothetical protein
LFEFFLFAILSSYRGIKILLLLPSKSNEIWN